MRIVLLVTDLERGGTPLRLARLALGLRERGVLVTAGCLAPPGPVSVELERCGVETFACGARGPWDWLALRRLAEHLGRFRPDLIHATLTHANVAARLVGWALRIPAVGSTATIEVERPLHVFLERRTGFLDEAHIVNSRAVAAHVMERFGADPARIRIVPPLVRRPDRPADRAEARRRLGLPPGAPVVAWVGRFDPAKRVDWLVRAAADPRCATAHFVLAGDGPLRAEVESLARDLGADARVHVLGWREDVWTVYAAADVLALPSLTEGMPNAALEALSAGVPVVGSAIPSLRELADLGAPVFALSRDEPEALAQSLAELAQDRARAHQLGSVARQWAVRRFDPQASIDATVHVYEEVLAGRLSRRNPG